jgi:hypothetical protein
MTMNTDYLAGWDVKKEQQKADFMEHMYQCSGRANGGLVLLDSIPVCGKSFASRKLVPSCEIATLK